MDMARNLRSVNELIVVATQALVQGNDLTYLFRTLKAEAQVAMLAR